MSSNRPGGGKIQLHQVRTLGTLRICTARHLFNGNGIQDAAALPQYNDAYTQPVVTELEEELAEHAEAHDTILIEQLAEAHRKLYIFRMDRAMARYHAGIEDGSDDDGAFGD